jgi:hypothetical protein
MFAGNIALAVCAVLIAAPREGWLSGADAAFWAVAAGVAAVRYLDISRLGGQTATGAPASPAHWRRYAWALAAVAAGLWLLAHLVSWWRR